MISLFLISTLIAIETDKTNSLRSKRYLQHLNTIVYLIALYTVIKT